MDRMQTEESREILAKMERGQLEALALMLTEENGMLREEKDRALAQGKQAGELFTALQQERAENERLTAQNSALIAVCGYIAAGGERCRDSGTLRYAVNERELTDFYSGRRVHIRENENIGGEKLLEVYIRRIRSQSEGTGRG